MKRISSNRERSIIVVLLVAIMFIGLGFAALSATLGITGHAIIGNISFDVHFENVEVREGSMEAVSPATIDASDNTQINFSLHLTTPGEFYEFETDIVNNGTLDAYLSSIELLGLDESTQKYLKVTYRYSNGGKIRINDLLKSRETERIKVRVDFLYDITLDDLPKEETSLDFTLNMTYTQDNGTGVQRDKSEVEVNILGQDMIAHMDNMKSQYVTNEKGVNFGTASSNSNGRGLYLRAGTENDKYPIYYYRGEVYNNHVLFGGFCWKIVRTTEKGGTKLIYDGVPSSNNQCNNTGVASQLSGTISFSDHQSLASVGYMYGMIYSYVNWLDAENEFVYGSDVIYENGLYTLKDTLGPDKVSNIKTKHYTCGSATDKTCEKVYYVYSYYAPFNNDVFAIELSNGDTIEKMIEKSFYNENDSNVKKEIDKWFVSNLMNQEPKLEDAIWCNDRSMVSGGYLKDFDLTLYAVGSTDFGARGTRNLITSIPSPAVKDEIACPNQNDRFTVNDNFIGNGALTYPVGMLTADEATIAGSGWTGYSNKSYLYTGKKYLLMTPNSAAQSGTYNDGFVVSSSGRLGADDPFSPSVRPSIVLKKGLVATSGDGTSSSPYVVE